MKQLPFDLLACPLDGLPLMREGQSMRCSSGHCYDVDRKGTLNLLPVQFKKSRHPGDSKDMVSARERFLNGGYYQPLSDKLNERLHEWAITGFGHTVMLDAGCGEGYYTHRLAMYLQDMATTGTFSMMGLDISKDAIQAASRRDRTIQWVVGTNANLPVQNHVVDIVLCLFGFPVWPEFRRVLKPGGRVICVDAGPDHLIELRQRLYSEIRRKTAADAPPPEGFVAAHTESLRFDIGGGAMTRDALQDLVAMTPHQHRATRDNIERAVSFSYDRLTADILFSVYAVTLPA